MIHRSLSFIASLVLIAPIATGALAQQPPPPDEDAPARIQIDLAQVLAQARQAMREQDYEKAIGLYQVVLRFLPESRVARVELSFALAILGEQERAARLLRDLDTEGLDPEVIDVISRIVGPDRLTFFFVPELFLDTNVGGQTKAETITINGTTLTLSEDAKGQEGYGYGLTFGASYRLRDLDPRTTLTGGLTIRDFEAGSDDEQSAFSSLSMRFDLGDRFALTPALSAVYRYDEWQPREAEIGAGLAAAMALGPVRNTLGGRYRHINGQRERGSRLDRNVYQIYDIVSFGFDSIAFRFDERYTYENWDHLQDQDRAEIESGLDLTFVDVPWTVPTVGGSFTYRDFSNDATFFGFERLDRVWEGHVEFLFRDWDLFGSNPFIRYEYTNQDSNIPLVDFDKHEISVGIRAIVF